MKRFLILILAILLLCGCVANDNQGSEMIENFTELKSINPKRQYKCIWLPIYEASPEVKDMKHYKIQTDEMMKNIAEFGFTDVFYQVRADCDSVYPSDIFKPNCLYCENGKLCFDALSVIISSAHKYNLFLHAWINPYRAGKCSDLPSGITEKDVFRNGDKLYLNPCSSESKKTVLLGVREILENYNVDGIHIDDYFYPSQDREIDKDEYNEYINSGGNMSVSDFRRSNVSALISSIYRLVKSYDENIIFSISPSANIEKNIDNLYADVKLWCSEEGYCDMILPQIYFGFENEKMPFIETYHRWLNLCDKTDIKLVPGLAVYKSGQSDKYAGKGEGEWINHRDIIKRQIEYLSADGADGFSLFSYNYIFGNINLTKDEVKNLKSVI